MEHVSKLLHFNKQREFHTTMFQKHYVCVCLGYTFLVKNECRLLITALIICLVWMHFVCMSITSMLFCLKGCLKSCISYDVLCNTHTETQTYDCLYKSPLWVPVLRSLALSSLLTNSKRSLTEDGCSFKKEPVDGYKSAPPFITAVLFRLDSYTTVTWATAMNMCVCVWCVCVCVWWGLS